MLTLTERNAGAGLRWIGLTGDLGDAMVLSKLLLERHRTTGEQFGIVRKPTLTPLFLGHPAVQKIAIPSGSTPTTSLAGTDGAADAYERFSLELFGEVVGERGAWAPVNAADLTALKGLPFAMAPIIVATAPRSPREAWPAAHWAQMVADIAKLAAAPIVQLNAQRGKPLPGVLDMSGRLKPRETIALVGLAQAVITVDPFCMHAAYMQHVPTLRLWGPDALASGWYPEQINLQGRCSCGDQGACTKDLSCKQALEPQRVAEVFATRIVPQLRLDLPLFRN